MTTQKFQEAYAVFNAQLFGNALPRVRILVKHIAGGGRGSYGTTGPHDSGAITMSPAYFAGHTDEEILSTLVHEMAHCWDHLYGNPAPGALHGDTWAACMQTVGLQPSGKAAQASHRITPGGAYARAYTKLQAAGWELKDSPAAALPGYGPQAGRPVLHRLTMPLPPRLPARTLGTQLTDGFSILGNLLGGSFHLALAVFVGWWALSVIDPIFSRWSSTWSTASTWTQHLMHLLFN